MFSRIIAVKKKRLPRRIEITSIYSDPCFLQVRIVQH